MSKEAFLDQLFTDGANIKLSRMKGKVYKYQHLDKDFQPISEGRCTVVDRYYSKMIDCDIITIKDIITGKMITDNQFNLELRSDEE